MHVVTLRARCYEFQIYIKPQQVQAKHDRISSCYEFQITSNHNIIIYTFQVFRVVMSSKLHQTTTHISLTKYFPLLLLVPKLNQTKTCYYASPVSCSCYEFQNYIKPQLLNIVIDYAVSCYEFQNYIKPQRLNLCFVRKHGCYEFQNYIKPQLSLYRELGNRRCYEFQNYIKPQLAAGVVSTIESCYEFQNYIKPQHGVCACD